MIYILIAILAVAALLLVVIVRANRSNPADNRPKVRRREPALECCGAHEVCEAESLLALSDKVVYYDDEELDAWRGKAPSDYSETQIDEFRDILFTLRTYEVAGWMRSLALRGIEPPECIREEALMIVDEFREQRRGTSHTR